jgi:hypothetical protein
MEKNLLGVSSLFFLKNNNMKPNLLMAIILPIFAACQQNAHSSENISIVDSIPSTINSILLPDGYTRIVAEKNTFTQWLRNIHLKKDKTVYLYNGLPKRNQSVQFAVLDISVGAKDLQQCADAVMRLRAEYLFTENKFSDIIFRDNNNVRYELGVNHNRDNFNHYLENVFAHCGSLSLQNQLVPIKNLNDVKPGDVLIQGGSPGHAMIVVDMAEDKNGKKIFLLAQSYMPAQDIHIVINPMDKTLSPWYELNEQTIYTPEWTFLKGHFRTW